MIFWRILIINFAHELVELGLIAGRKIDLKLQDLVTRHRNVVLYVDVGGMIQRQPRHLLVASARVSGITTTRHIEDQQDR
jgi:hypothetical protein